MVNDDFTQDRTPVGGLYLIAMTELVIAEDLRGAILEHEPGATVIIETSLADADRAVRDSLLPLRGAFVEASPSEFAASELAAALRAAGRIGVLLGDEAELRGPCADYEVLMRPFFTEDVHLLMHAPIAA